MGSQLATEVPQELGSYSAFALTFPVGLSIADRSHTHRGFSASDSEW